MFFEIIVLFLCRANQVILYFCAGYSSGSPQGEVSLSQFIKHRGEYSAPVALFAITSTYIQHFLKMAFERQCKRQKVRLALQILGWVSILATFSYVGMSCVPPTSYSQTLYDVFHSGPVLLAFLAQIGYFSLALYYYDHNEKKSRVDFTLLVTLYIAAVLTTGALQLARYIKKDSLPLAYPGNMYYAGFETAVLFLESIVTTCLYDVSESIRVRYI